MCSRSAADCMLLVRDHLLDRFPEHLQTFEEGSFDEYVFYASVFQISVRIGFQKPFQTIHFVIFNGSSAGPIYVPRTEFGCYNW